MDEQVRDSLCENIGRWTVININTCCGIWYVEKLMFKNVNVTEHCDGPLRKKRAQQYRC